MDWIVGIAVFVVILWIGSKMGSGDSQTETKSKGAIFREEWKIAISRDAQEIVDGITSTKQFHALERKLETAERRGSSDRKTEVLQAAVDKAKWKVLSWQFIPAYELGLETPKKVLEQAYKIFSVEEYEALKGAFSAEEVNWQEIYVEGEPEEPEPFIRQLIKFREIVESDEPKEGKIKQINQLASRNKEFKEEYFESWRPMNCGHQWFAMELLSEGLPLAYELYSAGFTTPEKCLEIDVGAFSSRKDVGEKEIEELKLFQEKVRQKLNKA